MAPLVKFTTWLAWLACTFANVGSYKLSSIPLNATGPDAGVAAEEQNVSELLSQTVLDEMEDFGRLPDPKEKGEKGESTGELGKSLEFLMLKVAQLETLAELQQTELGMQRELIEKLQKKVDPEEAEVSLAQKQRSSEESVQEAHDVLKRVVQKHAHQRKHREYHPEAHKQKPGPPADEEELEEVEEDVSDGHAESPAGHQRALLQKRESLIPFVPTPGLRRRIEHKIERGVKYVHQGVEHAVKTVDGTGLTGGALTEAYNAAKTAGKGIQFVANTAITTVEMAVSILTGGFSDWSASCTNNLPTVGMNGGELYVDFGHNSCSISLMGQRVTLFDWNWGRKAVNLNKIVEQIPPLSYLTRMSDILTEVIEVFAKVAGTVVQKAMENPKP